RFNAAEWANLNRADMTLAARLINVDLPALQQRLNALSASDFLRSVCVGVEQGGQCWLTPPGTIPGYRGFITGGECVPIVDIPGVVTANCSIFVPGIPSTTFNWLPDFTRSGWRVVDDISSFLSSANRVLNTMAPQI